MTLKHAISLCRGDICWHPVLLKPVQVAAVTSGYRGGPKLDKPMCAIICDM